MLRRAVSPEVLEGNLEGNDKHQEETPINIHVNSFMNATSFFQFIVAGAGSAVHLVGTSRTVERTGLTSVSGIRTLLFRINYSAEIIRFRTLRTCNRVAALVAILKTLFAL